MITPLKDFLLLKPLDDAGMTAGGVFIPSSCEGNEKIQRGEVVALGPDLVGDSYYRPYAIGDVVLYSVFGGNEIRDGREKLFLVPDKEVWAAVVPSTGTVV